MCQNDCIRFCAQREILRLHVARALENWHILSMYNKLLKTVDTTMAEFRHLTLNTSDMSKNILEMTKEKK